MHPVHVCPLARQTYHDSGVSSSKAVVRTKLLRIGFWVIILVLVITLEFVPKIHVLHRELTSNASTFLNPRWPLA